MGDSQSMITVPCIPWGWYGGLQILQNLGPQLGCYVLCMEGIYIYGFHSRLVELFPEHLYLTSYPTPPWGWCGGLKILPSLGPQFWWSADWMEGIHMYVLHLRLVGPFLCILKTCKMYGNPSMATGTLNHNLPFHVDGLVVLQILSDLGPHLGRSMAWMDEGIPMYGLHPRLVRHFQCIMRHVI